MAFLARCFPTGIASGPLAVILDKAICRDLTRTVDSFRGSLDTRIPHGDGDDLSAFADEPDLVTAIGCIYYLEMPGHSFTGPFEGRQRPAAK